jgi:hypothetical protein
MTAAVSADPDWRWYRGIRLGVWSGSGDDKPWYRIRAGRGLALATADGFPQEWRAAYVRWNRMQGQPRVAWALRTGPRSAA